MLRNLMILTAASMVFCVAHAGDIYKWTDENGHVHYGGRAPDSPKAQTKTVSIRNTGVSEEQRQEAEERLNKDKASLGHAPILEAPPVSYSRQNKSGNNSSKVPGTCADQQKKYRDSAACFDRYRLANGGVKAEAYTRCAEVKQPESCN